MAFGKLGWLGMGCGLGLLAGFMTPNAALACGPESDCALGNRSFRILLPDSGEPRGAIIFAHGYRGSAAGTMRNEGLTGLVDQMNVALVALEGVNGIWNTPNNPGAGEREGDEFTYVDALSDRLEQEWGIPAERTVVSGFSGGAMLVWNIACERGDEFAGFAPLSGTFWDPIPESCPTVPNNLIHFHGTQDEVVPLEGRMIRTTMQGDVHEALKMLLAESDFGAEEVVEEGDVQCRARRDSEDRLLEFCTFPGGHGYRPEFVAEAVEEFLPKG